MKIQEALSKLQAIMYPNPWGYVANGEFDWDHAQHLEQADLPWIPIARIGAWIIGPVRTGKLICLRGPSALEYEGFWQVVPMIQPDDPAYDDAEWCLFPWCPVKPPFSISDAFNKDLWRQPSCL